MTEAKIKHFILIGVIGSILIFPQQFAFNLLFIYLGFFVLFNPIIFISILITMFFISFIVMRKKTGKFKKIISFICLLLFVMFLSVLLIIDEVIYVATYNIIYTILFVVFFAGYYHLNKDTTISKQFALCSLVISCLSLIVFMLFFIDVDWFMSFRRIFFKLSSSWAWSVFFIGLVLSKTTDLDIKTMSLLLTILFLLHGFLSLNSYTFLYQIIYTNIVSLFGILSLAVGVLRLSLLIKMYIHNCD